MRGEVSVRVEAAGVAVILGVLPSRFLYTLVIAGG